MPNVSLHDMTMTLLVVSLVLGFGDGFIVSMIKDEWRRIGWRLSLFGAVIAVNLGPTLLRLNEINNAIFHFSADKLGSIATFIIYTVVFVAVPWIVGAGLAAFLNILCEYSSRSPAHEDAIYPCD
jgi:hypothetical protein